MWFYPLPKFPCCVASLASCVFCAAVLIKGQKVEAYNKTALKMKVEKEERNERERKGVANESGKKL